MATDPTVAAKVRIADSLKAFKSGALAINAVNFFESLGYSSDKTHELESNTAAGLLELANQPAFLNPAKAHAEEWKTVDFLFQLTDEEIRNFGRASLEFDSTVDVAVGGKHIESYIFFAVELEKDSYTRTDLADTTREINRLFPMPALVLFKHGESLTLSIINRRIHKRDIARDVLEKVTLIKDLNINNPHRGHIEILFDLALPQLIATHEVTNFVQLDDAWRKTLDTSVLNKRFYKELANWYFWALQNVEFPKQAGITDDVNRATNVIRLITRLIFVWFLKERELVPDALFDRASLDDLLKDLSPDKSTFYKAILQNLFFATLNTPMDDPNAPRVFRSETNGKRFNDQYMVHNQYRHQKLFKDPEHALEIFAGIPFLNGGLFECLDKPAEVDGKKVEIRIDGFSDVAKKQPTVPNKLFFGGEERIDLNETYGTRGKRYSVCGLIETLNRYKFTIAENTPIEEEVALDPELLGKVFENLLASYNPETGATARKQTGSFYTPREIVNYMVDESLIAYLETQLNSESKAQNVDNLNERLRQLFAYTDEPHQFSAGEVDTLIAAIDAVKILDPACGSGAFPMGILQRLVFILSKLDPNNAKWEQRQIERVREAMRAAEKIEDHKFRENTLNDLKLQIANINEAFKNNELDYGRKLFLIENCIYGVDIQPIAIQIAKLRFFISLIIDQKIRSEADNLGIRPLPNLETKFVAANTLLNIKGQIALRSDEIANKEKQLKKIRDDHFLAPTTRRKNLLRGEDQRLREEIGKLINQLGLVPPDVTQKLIAWNPYDQNESASFFDAEWMFGRERFDVVIGNPPYGFHGIHSRSDKEYFKQHYVSSRGSFEHYFLFYECGLKLLSRTGFLCFIAPVTWLTIPSATSLRKFVLSKFSIREICWLSGQVFEQAVNTLISLIQVNPVDQIDVRVYASLETFPSSPNEQKQLPPPSTSIANCSINIFSDEADERIIKKIMVTSQPLSHYALPCSGYNPYEVGKGMAPDGGAHTKLTVRERPYHSTRKLGHDWKLEVIGKDLRRYRAEVTGTRWVKYGPWLAAARDSSNFVGKRILVQEITGGREKRIVAAYTDKEIYHSRDVIPIKLNSDFPHPYYLLGLINSRLMSWYHHKRNPKAQKGLFPKVLVSDLAKLPIRSINKSLARDVSLHDKLVDLVTQAIERRGDDPMADITSLEADIDELVYEIYDLSVDEIAILK